MSEQDSSAILERGTEPLRPVVAETPNPAPPGDLDRAVAAFCQPISAEEPCGPDLDVDGDAAYLNYFAAVEGVFPPSFFSVEDGKPFDRTTVDLPGQIDALEPLLRRTIDVRLMVTRARLMVLNRDLKGFIASIAAIAESLDLYWDTVHPRIENGDMIARQSALAALELPTVVFALQYTPLFEARRIGAISYRAWMIANGEVKARDGEPTSNVANISAARGDADPATIAAVRRDVGLLRTSVGRIRGAFAKHGASVGLENLPALVDKIVTFIDPHAAESVTSMVDGTTVDDGVAENEAGTTSNSLGTAGGALADAKEALAAIAEYYALSEPSSPTLPLVRQAHQLVGKSFFEVMSVLVPTQLDKVAFQIGGDQVFELPLGKLPKPSEIAMQPDSFTGGGSMAGGMPATDAAQRRYRIESRPQAIALLEQVERHFRRTEPSSPVPWLCQRARALAERDFMAVLRDVLPKAALKNIGADK
ncbi:type VI secretion system ImpA family N-terminal domain-containing protein [Bradyrhizobium sp. JYMT SZCCT0428]|uniref:type VI secretion system protein TssA n=1 Tax=Bradyrhizobium sp. JYMT SZCCT0428 TaxID=2807673 RepID=UPI001BACCE0B|nr:type VI secretion system ImpA family N-terminal domain-containing protein [Bradyrhizobium sp. JYMT SZCCT0428]MBR1155213.1 type VI secretion system ImpA family N-terminal domain-containing protein [Bradyrhizobium sp. JYMT SZCCT0428]